MRIAIASRIFGPEPSAASFRLGALVDAFSRAGDQVTVLTVWPPKSLRSRGSVQERSVSVKRFPVLRDRTGYVRGYLQYMSFDIPLFFRVLFGARRDVIVVEPPPTTGAFVRVAAAIRRMPYAYYAADVWSDAAESTGAPSFVVNVVRELERFALRGADLVLSVNEGVTERVRELVLSADIVTVGNGVDTAIFSASGEAQGGGHYFVYAGTASEWQGAEIFIEAFAQVLPEFPQARLVFLGQGSDWPTLQSRAADLPGSAVEFIPTVPPDGAAKWLRGAVASVASIRPDAGYSFAFPTKVFASWATGTPVIFAGDGLVVEYMSQHEEEIDLGHRCDYDSARVAAAMRTALAAPPGVEMREQLGHWAELRVSLRSVAERTVIALRETCERGA